jgi:hypothetical protein
MSARPIETFNLRERIEIVPTTVKTTKAPTKVATTAALPDKLKVNLPASKLVAPTAASAASPSPTPLPFLKATNNQFKFMAAAKAVAAQPDSPLSTLPTPAPRIEASANLRLAAQFEEMKMFHQKAQKLAESNATNLKQTATILITERKEHQLAISRLQNELATAAEIEARLKAQLAERPAKASFNDAEFSQRVQAAVEDENAVTTRKAEIAELNVQLTTQSDRKVLLAAEISALETLRDAASEKLESIRSEYRDQKAITNQCSEEHRALVAQKASLVKEVADLKAQGVNQVKVNEENTLRAINEQVATARAELLKLNEDKVKRSRRVVADAEDVWERAGHVADGVEEAVEIEALPLSPATPRAPQAFDESIEPSLEVLADPSLKSPLETADTDFSPSSTSALVEPHVELMDASLEPIGDEPVIVPTEALSVPQKVPPPSSEELVMLTDADLIQLEEHVTAVEAEVAMEKMETLETLMPELRPPLPPPLLPLSPITASKTNVPEAQTAPVTYTPIARPKSIRHLMPNVANRGGIAIHLPQVQHTMGTGEFKSSENDSNLLVEAVIYDLRARFSA